MKLPYKIIAAFARISRSKYPMPVDEIAEHPVEQFREMRIKARIADQWFDLSQFDLLIDMEVDGERETKTWRECKNIDLRGAIMEQIKQSNRKYRKEAQ